jgi:hypothetical protein
VEWIRYSITVANIHRGLKTRRWRVIEAMLPTAAKPKQKTPAVYHWCFFNMIALLLLFCCSFNNAIPLHEHGEVRRGLKTRRRRISEAEKQAIDTGDGEHFLQSKKIQRLYIT